MDNLDRAFQTYLKEIQKAYISFPKAQRIRIEKWVEKLSCSGSNVTWRKHRNSYTKLLLNMIIEKSLGDPFHIPPPDGPLAPFPTHLMGKTQKNLLGPHESSFWRELFKNVDNSNDGDEPQIHDRHSGIDSTISSINQPGPYREISNLKLLIKEQQQRIELLEQQLKEERVKHELELQRVRYSHKIELEKIKQIKSEHDELNTSKQSHDHHSAAPIPSNNAFSSRMNQSYTHNNVQSTIPQPPLPQMSSGYGASQFLRQSQENANIENIVKRVQSGQIPMNTAPISTSTIDKSNHSYYHSTSSSPSPPSLGKPASNLQSSSDDFMAYLEKFQSELKNLQNMASPLR